MKIANYAEKKALAKEYSNTGFNSPFFEKPKSSAENSALAQ